MAGDATHPADFSTANISDPDLADGWPRLVRFWQDMAAVWQACEFSADSAPDKQLLQFYISDDTLTKAFRIGQDGTDFRIDKNTGSDATPSWTNMLKLNISTLAATLPAGLTITGALAGVTTMTLAGDLNLGGNDITNVGAATVTTINGVDPSAHATNHAPGGSDAVSVGTPVDVGSANAPGSSSNLVRADHVHGGVKDVDVNTSGSPLQGSIDIQDGANIDVTKAGSVITIAAPREAAYHTRISGGNDSVSASTETIVQDSAGSPNLLQVTLTNADGAKEYHGWFRVQVNNASGSTADLIFRLRVGSLGTLSDALVDNFDFNEHLTGDDQTYMVPFVIDNPAANDIVTISIESTQAVTVRASGTERAELFVDRVAA